MAIVKDLVVNGDAKIIGNTTSSKFVTAGGTSSQFVKGDGSVDSNSYSTTSHTHTTSIATSTGTNQISLAANTKYAITAGGTSYVFTTPPNPENNVTHTEESWDSSKVVVSESNDGVVSTSNIAISDVSDAVSKKHSHSSLTLSTTAQAYDGSHTLALPSSDPYSSARTPTSHASSATTYGVGTTANYGHVKTQTGDMNGTSSTNGIAAGLGHTHSNYAPLASPALTGTPTAPTATAGTNTTQIATTAFVKTAIDNMPEPMIFKGSVGTDGTVTWANLASAAAANEGWTYKVITAHTADTKCPACKVGDTIISNGSAWIVIPSGDEPSGTVTSVTIKATSPIAIDSTAAITSSGTRTLSHATSGVTEGTYKSVTVNATGHVTGGTNPTTIAGYGITDAKIASGTITLGSNSITPLTSHQACIKSVTDDNDSSYTAGSAGADLRLKNGSNVSITADSTGVTIAATDTTYESKAAASGGTAVSLVTTGEKYTWNNKSTVPTSHASTATTYGVGTTSNYGHVKLATGDMNGASGADGVAVGKNHTHSQYSLTSHTHATSIATSTGTNQITLAANTKYAITAGGTSYVFTTPPDGNTDTKVSQSATTTANWRKVILSYQNESSAGAAVSENTNVVYGAVGVEVQPSTNTLKAAILRAANNDLYVGSASNSQCHQQYDATNKCLKFIFD